MEVSISGNHIYVKFDFDPGIIRQIKAAGGRWQPKRKQWAIPDNLASRGAVNAIQPGTFRIDDIAPDPDFRPLKCAMSHQVRGLRIAWKKKSWGYWYDTGTGKTLLALEIIRMYQVKTLVVCPLTAIRSAWSDDIEKFGYEFAPVVDLWAAWKKKKTYEKALNGCRVGIINFESFKNQIDHIKKAGFRLLILDESSACKNPRTAISKKMTEFAKDIPLRYLLSGTPAPNSPMEYFSQCQIIDPGVFGASFWRFRNKFFTKMGFNYIMKPEKKQEFNEKLASISCAVRKEDVLDLPPRTDIIRSFVLSPAEKRRHDGAVAELVEQLARRKPDGEKNQDTAKLLKAVKQRQITSGFIYDEEKNVEEIGNSKIKVFQELIDEIHPAEQVLIWTQFRPEVDHISAVLPDGSYGICNGMVSRKTQEQAISDFKAGKKKYLIAHPGSLRYAVTFTGCCYAIYYSISHSLEAFWQSKDRIYRYGQERKCFYYYLLAEKSVDFQVLKALNKKESAAQAVLNYLRRL